MSHDRHEGLPFRGSPVPFRDDPEAPFGLREDLERLRAARSGYDVDAGFSRLAAALQVVPTPGHAPPSVAPPAAPSLAPAAAASGLGAKGLWWGLGAVGVASLAGLWLATHRASPPAPAPRDASAVVAPTPSPVEASKAPAPVDTTTPIEVVLDDEAAPSPHAHNGGRPAGAAPSSEAPSASLLAEEVAHLAALRAASGDPSRALAMAEEGQHKFARGVFGQEREAIAIGALARLGRAGEAKSRAQSFLTRHPKSPLAEGVRRAAGID